MFSWIYLRKFIQAVIKPQRMLEDTQITYFPEYYGQVTLTDHPVILPTRQNLEKR